MEETFKENERQLLQLEAEQVALQAEAAVLQEELDAKEREAADCDQRLKEYEEAVFALEVGTRASLVRAQQSEVSHRKELEAYKLFESVSANVKET